MCVSVCVCVYVCGKVDNVFTDLTSPHHITNSTLYKKEEKEMNIL